MSQVPFALSAQPAPQELVAQAPVQSGKDAEAAKQFEGMLMTNLFQCLRKTVSHSSLFGNSSSQSTYEYLLDQAVVQHGMASGQGWGLSERLKASWSQDAKINETFSAQDFIS